MKYLALLLALVIGTAASAQDFWTVWTCLKTIDRFTEENRELNTVSVFPARLKQGYMRVNYHQKEKEPGLGAHPGRLRQHRQRTL